MYLSKGVLIVLPDSTVDPDKLAGCGIERSSKGFELSRLYHISTKAMPLLGLAIKHLQAISSSLLPRIVS